MHAVVVGSDMNAQTKFETQLREFVAKNGIQDRVHFINKTLAVAPYLSAIDVLVQNSQVSTVMYLYFILLFPHFTVTLELYVSYIFTFPLGQSTKTPLIIFAFHLGTTILL
jgi:hypothetical protein